MWRVVLAGALFSSLAASYNILGLFPHAGRSHFNAFEPLLKELAARGHNVTVISHFPQAIALPRYKDVSLKGTDESSVECFAFQEFSYARLMKYYEPLYLAALGRNSCERALQSQDLLNFLEHDREARFDAVIAGFFNSDCLLGFVHMFRAPLIGIGSNTLMSWTNMRFGNIDHPAYVPNNFLDHTDRLTFLERVENTVMNVFVKYVYYHLIDTPTYEIVKPHFGDDLPPLSQIAANASIMLSNSHYSLFRPRPLVPAVIEVCGLHIGENKPLPKVFLLPH